MKILEKIKKIFNKTTDTFEKNRDKERIAAETRLNEYLAEEQKRKKLLDKSLSEELQAKNKDEERIAAETRLNEYLAEEQKRKKILDESLSEELQTKKRNEKQQDKKRNKKGKIEEVIAFRKMQHEQNVVEQDRIQKQTMEQQRIEEINIVMQRVEKNRLGKNKSEELSKIKEPKPNIDTRFIYQEEVAVTNIGPGRLKFDKFQGKIGHTPKKRD